MALKKFKPYTPSNRYKELPSFEEITKDTPEKSLLSPLKISKANRTIFRQFDFHFWFADLNLIFCSGNPCFDFLPVTLFLHILKDDVFKFERIN